jgi:methionine-rich copper-binding protein CopC
MSIMTRARARRASTFAAIATLVLIVSAFAAPHDTADMRRHTRLVRSEPAKDSVVRLAPTELRLWFSETLDLAVTRVTLADGNRQPVAVNALTRAEGADAPIVAPLNAALPDGNYTVTWSTSSKDGHPVRGTFRFSVRVTP